MKSTLLLALVAVVLPVGAQPAPAASAPVVPVAQESADAPLGGEPNVRHTVIEDDGSKIDELKVRGQTRRITVTPKVGPKKSYEIITGDASQDISPGSLGPKSAIGKRVWNVLAF